MGQQYINKKNGKQVKGEKSDLKRLRKFMEQRKRS